MAGTERVDKSYPRCDPSLFEQVPVRLRSVNQWVCWRAVKREATQTAKVPVDPATGREAQVTNPRTWGTYPQALARFARDPTLHGLGFVFTGQDPFTGVDVDDCRDPATGQLGDWAQSLVEKLDSYAEVSPSGTGVKVILEAVSPGKATRRNKVEIYSHARYFTLTGRRLETSPVTVNARQAELADLYAQVFGAEPDPAPPSEPRPGDADPKLARVRALSDEELLTRAREAANGEKFKQLYDRGDTSLYNGDRSRADAGLAAILSYWTRKDSPRVDRLFRLSKLFRKKWDERRGSETYGARTLRHALGATTAVFDPDLDQSLGASHNDVANAEILIQLRGTDFVWCDEWRTWLRWDTHRWLAQAGHALRVAAEQVSQELQRRLITSPPADARELAREIKWAVGAGDVRRLDAIEKVAKSRLAKRADLFDRDAYQLGVANGVVDLRTGELRDGGQADWLTRSTGVRYESKAKCPHFDKFLSEVMEGDGEMVSYLWRVMGYCLTGDVTERAFFLLHGSGRNGKTTFVETLRACLGTHQGYAQKARFATFLRKNVTGGANDDVAHLAGARLVVASEADQANPLDTSLVKELTGADAVRARFLYAGEFEFTPRFKLFLVTNHVPPIYEATHSLWDRLHYVDFSYRVSDEKLDRQLPLTLLGELEGILAKCIASCLVWQAEGLRPPEKVLKARKRLYEQMDTFGQFLDEACERGDADRTHVTHRALYHAFTLWAREGGIARPPSAKSLAAYLRGQKYTERKTGTALCWLGLRLSRHGHGGSDTGLEL